ncbi:hypothetical protein CONCODRAFT_70477 [Conidiobolus coronatus NRRL 28638]|uniref:F-box domain-containing protein n=1 Tax=Conidiobolus coronatus (strain ATCC 28846 / CBS 209.66 / NRRL 28638) TaxID=796925 RepID=A0A137P6X9_CONC2|nr:hypothetical protein CONCODRAFT_70477 [Conidiobolus coronatus NRRL 28638]|eukprot:KXN70681.1 hypothetical protein CONCODRAFT_70477 [Conidiobolus coronatus NRRL 28638]
MTKINWELIFINNSEFKGYLNSCDIMEMSKLSKLVRLKLKSGLFENITIGHTIDDFIVNEYSKLNSVPSCNADLSNLSVKEYIPLFRKYIQNIIPYIKRINIISGASHYQLLEVSNQLARISILSIYQTRISLSAFQSAINKFQYLESLSIKKTSFIIYKNEKDSVNNIKLPSSLKYLNWSLSKSYIVTLERDPQLIKYSYGRTLIEGSYILIQPEHFSNLVKYSSDLSHPDMDKELASLNPNLVSISLNIFLLTREKVSILKSLQSIKKLELSITQVYCDKQFFNFNFPNLTHLCFHYAARKNWPILVNVILSSPNLSEFNIGTKSYTNCNIFELINIIKKLKKLTIRPDYTEELDFKDFKSNSNLNYLEIWYRCDINSVLDELAKFTNLNQIAFKSKFFDKDYLSSISQENTSNRWRIINTQEFIKYYKLT